MGFISERRICSCGENYFLSSRLGKTVAFLIEWPSFQVDRVHCVYLTYISQKDSICVMLRFEPGLLQSSGWKLKPRFSLAVRGTSISNSKHRALKQILCARSFYREPNATTAFQYNDQSITTIYFRKEKKGKKKEKVGFTEKLCNIWFLYFNLWDVNVI